MSEKLSEIFLNDAIKDFGNALRKMIVISKDYGTLVEIEYSETLEQFKEVLWKFLRKLHTEKYKKPTEKNLEELIKLVDKFGVKQVRAALIAHALVKSSEEEGGE
jgi:FPC/CPF motif-containing protein YcgG